MPIKRTAQCDICGSLQIEDDLGTGFAGWAIVQGISMIEPVGTLTQENTQTMLCEVHKQRVADFLDFIKAEET